MGIDEPAVALRKRETLYRRVAKEQHRRLSVVAAIAMRFAYSLQAAHMHIGSRSRHAGM